MQINTFIEMVFLVLLITGSAYFSAMETGLMTLGRLRVRHLVEQQTRGAQRVERLLSNPGRLLGTLLIGNNMVNIAATSIGTLLAISYFGEATGVVVATVTMTVIILIFGEITPKTYGMQHSQHLSLHWSGPLSGLYLVLGPLPSLLEFISRSILRLLGVHASASAPTFSEDELRTLVTVGQEEGILQIEEKDMITSIIEFGDTLVSEIMTPRTEVVRVSTGITYTELLDILRRDNFSRVPIYENGIDDIVGILNVKDLLGVTPDAFVIKQLLRPPYFVPEFKRVSELLAEFKRKKLHIAIVVDEYGGTAGIITLEDLVEEIIGEIADEYDVDEEPQFTYIDENTIELTGSLHVREAAEIIGRDLPEGEYDTVGGMLMYTLGTVPVLGQNVEISNLSFTIQKMDGSRVDSVLVRLNTIGTDS
ncbi:MAG: HlyC/CorC family transporter [Peptococcaceae bacterium]|nr:HlyC/CorC family transporter [Peptococcaceae bacterium]